MKKEDSYTKATKMIIRLQNEKAELLYENQLLKNKKAELEKKVKAIDDLHGVSGCNDQWHTLSANMGEGKCSKCGKDLNDQKYFR